jgi:hypothetical protein
MFGLKIGDKVDTNTGIFPITQFKFDEKTGLDRLKNRLKTEKPSTSEGFRVNCANGYVFDFVAYYLLIGCNIQKIRLPNKYLS